MIAQLRNFVSRIVRMVSSSASTPASWFVDWIRQTDSDSGVHVDGYTASKFAPVWYAVRRISGHVSQLPFVLYARIDDDTRRKAVEHPAFSLMHAEPNDFQTSRSFRALLQHHALLWGNGRAVIFRNAVNAPTHLVPLLPHKWDTVFVSGQKFHVRLTNRTTHDPQIDDDIPDVLPDANVLHIAGLGYDGVRGYSLINLMRNSIGLGLAAEKHMNRHFRNNAVPTLMLNAPPGIFRDEAAAQEFINNFNKTHAGIEQSGKAGLLREGITAQTLTIPGRDAQWIEQRRFQRQEAALFFLLESILGDDSSVSYNSLEQKNLAYLTNCLTDWLLNWELECNRKLLTADQRERDLFFFKFTTAALLRATTKERYEIYQIGRQIGVLAAEECRALEDLGPKNPEFDYSNPAITPGPVDVMPQENDRLRTMMADRLADIINYEIDRVCSAASTAKNFLAWADSFYKTFTERLMVTYHKCGGTPDDARAHANESQSQLVDLAGQCTQDQLPAAVQAATEQWRGRANTIAETLLARKVQI